MRTLPAAGADPSWVRPLGRRQRRTDVVIAAACLAGTAVTLPLFATSTTGPQAPAVVDVVWALAVCVPLALRRIAPAVVAAIVTAATILGQAVLVPEQLIGQVALVLALYSVGAWSADRRRSVVVRTALVAALAVWMVVGLVAVGADPSRLPAGVPFATAAALSILTNAVAVTATLVFGETAWQSARRLAALEERTRQLTEERERTARQAVALDRVRIARELHDVVAHHVSVMGVQAGAARLSLGAGQDRAADSLAAIESSARQAVDDLHRLLHTLRDDGEQEDPTSAASVVGVERLDALVAESAGAGLPARLAVSGDPLPLAPATTLALYRVAQEALTNVRKHAGEGAAAEVRLSYGRADVVLEVQDAGGRRDAAAEPAGTGLGRIGMQERLHAVGGRLDAGPTGDGWVVRASVPVGSGAEP